MAEKVYWKSLRLVLGNVKRYISKWNVQLNDNLTTEEMVTVTAVYNAVVTCLNTIPQNEPE